MKQPNLIELLHQILAPIMPMVRIENQLIVLGSLEHAIANNDGTITLYFASQRIVTLDQREAGLLANTLDLAMENAQKVAAKQRAAEMFGLKNIQGQ